MSIDQHDEKRQYCRKLGHDVPFDYCRKAGTGELPCRNLLDCWYEQLDIGRFVESHYTKQQIQAFLSPPAPKIASLISLVEEAKKRIKAGESEETADKDTEST